MTQWRIIILITAASFVRDVSTQVDTSLALIWTTTLAFDGRASIFFLYGDPNSYRDQMQRNETFNNQSSTLYLTRNANTSHYFAMETDPGRSQIYFSQSTGYLTVGPMPTLGASYNAFIALVPALSNLVTGLSVDFVSNLIYWSDAIYQRICVVETQISLFWRPVVESGLTSPQDVAVYPQQGFLFWTDSSPKIERLELATNIRQTIVSSSYLQRPTTLVIDFVAQRLIFLDSTASRIGFVNFDGYGLSFWSMQLLSSISSFVIFKDYIFLGDRTQPKSYAFNFTQRTFVGCVTAEGRTGVIDMTVNAPEKQPPFTSPCSPNNGGCNHFCITKNATASVCQCAMGFFLDYNGTTCNPELLKDNFLLVSDQYQNNIFQVHLGTGEVRAASVTPDDLFSITAMDYDPDSNTVYGFDSQKHSIRQVTLADHTTSTILQFQDTNISSLAVDPVGWLLYYVNYDSGSINRASLSGADPRPVVSGDGTLATAIALDVQNRLMFWSDCGSRRSIERAQISNPSSHQSVVTVSGLCATSIAIDVPNQVIYWADNTGRLEQASYCGTGRLLVRLLPSTFSIKGLAVDANFVYISGSNQRQIQKINRNTSELSNLTGIRFSNPYSVVLFSSGSFLTPGTRSSCITTSVETSSTSTGRSTSTSSITPAFESTVPPIVIVTASTSSYGHSASVTTPEFGSTRTSTDTTIILAAVICGSFVLIAVIVTLGIIFGRRCRKKPQRVEGTRPTVTAEDTQQMDNGGYAVLNYPAWVPAAGSVDTVSGFVGGVYVHQSPPYVANHRQLEGSPSKNEKYMSIYPPTYAELIKSEDEEPHVPPSRQRDVTSRDSDDYEKV